jgi:hypothetical protein
MANEERQVFIKQKSGDYKSFLTKCSSPWRCSPSSAWRERRMDFVPEKPVLEVDEVCPSRPGGEGTGGESTVKDADGEVPLPVTASEEEEPTLMHAVVNEELRPPVAEVAYPLAIVVDLDAVLWPTLHSRSVA